MPVLARGRVEGAGDLPGAVADQEPEGRGPVTEVPEQVADLLGGPRAVRVGGDPQDVPVTGADLHDEQAVPAPERYRAVHLDEVSGQHGRGWGVQELRPGRIGASLGSLRDP